MRLRPQRRSQRRPLTIRERCTRPLYDTQPSGLITRRVEAGLVASAAGGLRGRDTSSPLQFGHLPPNLPSAHEAQNVHSKEQMRASTDCGGRSRLQHSQFGRSSSIGYSKGPLVTDTGRVIHVPAERRYAAIA